MATNQKYIMLADDDADDRMLFEEALREICSDSKLITTIDGIDLLNILNETVPPVPDVIFLDINMPRLNGMECLGKIRGDLKLKSIPVIVYSTSNNQENIDLAYIAGANYYARKPSSFGELKSVIQRAFKILAQPFPSSVAKKDFMIN